MGDGHRAGPVRCSEDSRHWHCFGRSHTRGDLMQIRQRIIRIATLSAGLTALGACANTGGLGSVLGGILGGTGSGQQLYGTVLGVDTRNSQISVQQSNGQSIPVLYDQNTKVVYQNRFYSVTNLENGDQISARVQTTQNNAYYTH